MACAGAGSGERDTPRALSPPLPSIALVLVQSPCPSRAPIRSASFEHNRPETPRPYSASHGSVVQSHPPGHSGLKVDRCLWLPESYPRTPGADDQPRWYGCRWPQFRGCSTSAQQFLAARLQRFTTYPPPLYPENPDPVPTSAGSTSDGGKTQAAIALIFVWLWLLYAV